MAKPKSVKLYDTTLRDGCQAEGVSFSVKEKILIAHKLDELGIHYIEGGWPGSNPKDIEFFQEIANSPMKNAIITAFGSTRRAKCTAEEDPNLQALVESKTKACAIFGKSWTRHVTNALRVPLEMNLEMIKDSVEFLAKNGIEVIYDAEHFFDGYKDDPGYAIETLKAAEAGGASNLSLCDTNGGSLPNEIQDIMQKVMEVASVPVGIHCHNDSGLAVANSLIAVQEGAQLVQATMNGYGERCGNADLCSIIPNLVLKAGVECVSKDKLKGLTQLSMYVSELGNIVPNDRQPFVGRTAFAHKGGIHVSAVQRDQGTYEHITPEEVGNERRILVSELAGRSNLLSKAKNMGINIKEKETAILNKIKERENEGYDYEVADASLELLMRETSGDWKPEQMFQLVNYRVICEKTETKRRVSEATVRITVGEEEHFLAAEGSGPVDALNKALVAALEKKFGNKMAHLALRDYKVRIINPSEATAAKVRVLIESGDKNDEWVTVGVSEDIIEASWEALADSIEYKLLKENES